MEQMDLFDFGNFTDMGEEDGFSSLLNSMKKEVPEKKESKKKEDKNGSKPKKQSKGTAKKYNLPVAIKGYVTKNITEEEFPGKSQISEKEIWKILEEEFRGVSQHSFVLVEGKSGLVMVSKHFIEEDLSKSDKEASYVLAGKYSEAISGNMEEAAKEWAQKSPCWTGCGFKFLNEANAFVAIPQKFDNMNLKLKEPVSITTMYGYDEPVRLSSETKCIETLKDAVTLWHNKVKFDADIEEYYRVISTEEGSTIFVYLKEKGKNIEVKTVPLPVALHFTFRPPLTLTREMIGTDSIKLADIQKWCYDNVSHAFAAGKTELNYIMDHAIVTVGCKSSTKGCLYYDTVSELVSHLTKQDWEKGTAVVDGKYYHFEKNYIGLFLGELSENMDDENEVYANYGFKIILPKIPESILEDIVSYFQEDLTKEAMVQIFFDKKRQQYFVYKPMQITVGSAHIKVKRDQKLEFDPNNILVMDIHSHNKMSAFFSCVDDEDEKENRLYGVIGNLHNSPTMCFRAMIDGHEIKLDRSIFA